MRVGGEALFAGTVLLVLLAPLGCAPSDADSEPLVTDGRRDLLLDAEHVELLEGFEGRGALTILPGYADVQGDVALPVPRNSRLRWQLGAAGRPGRFVARVARLVTGTDADPTLATVRVGLSVAATTSTVRNIPISGSNTKPAINVPKTAPSVLIP